MPGGTAQPRRPATESPPTSANDRPETAQFNKPRKTPAPISLPPLFHVGIIVEDFDRVVADYEKRWGVSTEQITDLEFPTAKLHREGRPLCPLRLHKDGIFGDRLIQPLGGRSPYTEFLDLHGEGVHHLAYVVGSIDQHLESLRATGEGAPVTFKASIAGRTRFLYLDGLAHGPAIELIEVIGEDA
ncbi:VOC family protein [Streptomyces sp. 150FB]|uniref:VOC family protein n=1 Tax=Streptomyces sp. 150FB TaxID=1576605 RepID=UPI001364CACE|nr:VOC family protein [Streptomyces sp. 150FB]